jgi:hypothetical protein
MHENRKENLEKLGDSLLITTSKFNPVTGDLDYFEST